jgi:glycosyltransferase involved in cell wall biosynthesis
LHLTIAETSVIAQPVLATVTRSSPAIGRPRRVALVTDWFAPRVGGIELHVADLARALQARGIEVVVLTTTPGDSSLSDIPVQRISSSLWPGTDLAISPRLIGKFRAAFTAGRFDVVHVHISVISPAGYAAVLAAQALGLPLVATFHSLLLGTTHVLRAINRLWRWSQWPMVVAGVSGMVAQNLRRAAPGLAVEVLPNGVDPSFWGTPAPPRRQTADKVVTVTAMRLSPKKRPRALLRAFRIARECGRAAGKRMILHVAGDGPERPQLERYRKRHGLTDDIVFLGTLSRRALASLYREAHLFAMSSIRESFGIAVLEARCAGLPVVALKASGATEFLRNGETALLADDDNQFAHLWARLAIDDELRNHLSGSDDAVERFAWPAVAEEHISCYLRAADLVRSGGSAFNSKTT